MPKQIVYSAYQDGTHAHHRADGIEYCTQRHKKPISTAMWLLIAIAFTGWFGLFVLLSDRALRMKGY